MGLQLYTVRKLMSADFDGTLAAVAKVGYREVEFAGYFGRTPIQVKASLSRAGLVAPSAHVPVDEVLTKLDASIDAIAGAGIQWLVAAWIPEEQRRTLSDWQRLAEQFNRAAETAKKRGVRFAYHNHDYEFVKVQGKLPYDVLLEGTDPGLVKMEMDVYWLTKGGQDPLAYFKRWPGRFPLLHVKDMAKDGAMVDVGAGVINWSAIYVARREAGIEHWFVEHDEAADPMRSLQVSYRYLSALGQGA